MSETTLMRRSQTKVRFSNADMDFFLQWVLGMHTYGGAAPGEVFHACGAIRDGDPESWVNAFSQLGEYIRAAADELSETGHSEEAAAAYLRAFSGYRAAAQFMDPRADGEHFTAVVTACKDCFDRARPGFGHPCQSIHVPFEGAFLPGHFYTVDAGGQARPTLIMIGGGDTYCEDLYFWAGAVGPRRGYNVLAVDLPGQGDTPTHELFLRPDTEVPFKAVMDYALARPEVDSARVAAYGISGGGYFVTRAAAHEHRLAAVIADTPISDVYRVMVASVPRFLLDNPRSRVAKWSLDVVGRMNRVGQVNMGKYAWQIGRETFMDGLEMAKTDTVDIRAITCPMLCLAGEGDPPECITQTHRIYDGLRSERKALRFFTAAEGAESHCHVGNFPLLHQVLFGWLDDLWGV